MPLRNYLLTHSVGDIFGFPFTHARLCESSLMTDTRSLSDIEASLCAQTYSKLSTGN